MIIIFQKKKKGFIKIPYYLLKNIDIYLFKYIFLYTDNEDIKIISFRFITEICIKQNQIFIEFFGIKFFIELLNDNHPSISYFSSLFLMNIISKNNSEKYYNFLTYLLQKSQNEENVKLLDNPYFQIKELFSL
jgi:hypothetical protein